MGKGEIIAILKRLVIDDKAWEISTFSYDSILQFSVFQVSVLKNCMCRCFFLCPKRRGYLISKINYWDCVCNYVRKQVAVFYRGILYICIQVFTFFLLLTNGIGQPKTLEKKLTDELVDITYL